MNKLQINRSKRGNIDQFKIFAPLDMARAHKENISFMIKNKEFAAFPEK